jgi:DNA-binding SARP family transcriptional activator
VALALQQQYDRALTAIQESQQFRELSGGYYFITLHSLLAGLVLSLCGRHDQGLRLLDKGIEEARRMPTEYLEACGLLHRASVFLAVGLPAEASEDIAAGLRLMRRNTYRHFWAWTPMAREKILTCAVTHRIEPEYARILAARGPGLALLENGTALPLLDIQALGGFTILCQGITLLEAENLTPRQRELLALLLAAPEMKLPQETIQLYFWPDSTADAVKIKFDTLVSRLRKTLAEILPENTVHLYLNREKGMIRLAHCRVDAHQFLDGTGRGMIHYRLQEFWQAGTVFTTAASLWKGEFAPGVAGDGRIRAFRDTLVRSLAEMTLAWTDLLAGSNRLPQAIQVAEKALDNDPLNDRLHGLLYRLQGQHSAIHARRVLKRFEAALQCEGYPQDEIAELVAEITALPTLKNHPSSL